MLNLSIELNDNENLSSELYTLWLTNEFLNQIQDILKNDLCDTEDNDEVQRVIEWTKEKFGVDLSALLSGEENT